MNVTTRSFCQIISLCCRSFSYFKSNRWYRSTIGLVASVKKNKKSFNFLNSRCQPTTAFLCQLNILSSVRVIKFGHYRCKLTQKPLVLVDCCLRQSWPCTSKDSTLAQIKADIVETNSQMPMLLVELCWKFSLSRPMAYKRLPMKLGTNLKRNIREMVELGKCKFEYGKGPWSSMRGGKSVSKCSNRISLIINKIWFLGFLDSRIVGKFLVKLCKRFGCKILLLEDSKDLNYVSVLELMSALQAQ